MEIEQQINTKSVQDNASSSNQVETSDMMAGDCKESTETAGTDNSTTIVQQTDHSATMKIADPTTAEAARVELTEDAKTGAANVEEAGGGDQVSEPAAPEAEIIFELTTMGGEKDDQDIEQPAAETSIVESAGATVPEGAEEAKSVNYQKELAASEDAKSEERSSDIEDVEPVAHVIEDDDDEDDGDPDENLSQDAPDEEEEMSENGSDLEQVDEVPDDDSQESVDGDHEEDDDVYHVEGSQDDEDENRSAEESQDEDDDDDELEVMREEYESNEKRKNVQEHRADDEDDDDVAVISDTSDEEPMDKDDEEEEVEQEDQDDSDRNSDNVSDDVMYSDDECQSDMSEADEDDLMDVAIVSRPRNEEVKMKSVPRKPKREEKFKNAKVERRHRIVDWRQRLKKRSLKWLNPFIGNPAMRNVFESDHVNLIISNVTSSTKQAEPSSKSQSETVDLDSDTPDTNTSNMQQINQISECIKKYVQNDDNCQEVAKHQNQQETSNVQSSQQSELAEVRKADDNNKENIRGNVKDETNLPKINGSQVEVKTATCSAEDAPRDSNFVQDPNESDEMEVMEISDEPSDEIAADNATVIETQHNERSSTCDIKSMPSLQEAGEDARPKKESSKVAMEKDADHPIKIDALCKEKEIQENKTDDCQQQSAEDLPKTNPPKPSADSIAPIVSSTPVANRTASNSSAQVSVTIKIEPPSPSSEQTTKRPRSDSQSEDQTAPEDLHPTKKLKSQLDSNFSTHDRILNEYIEKTSNNTVDEIQKHLGQLIVEIHGLNDMIKTKEMEWNNLLHLKKVKEEICLRLTRKKQVMEIMSTKLGQPSAGGDADVTLLAAQMDSFNSLPVESMTANKLALNVISAAANRQAAAAALAESTPIVTSKSLSIFASTPTTPTSSMTNANATAQLYNHLSNISAISASSGICGPSSLGASGSIVKNILENRANMKTSDLIREKATADRVHRILVSRNILPKPSSIPSAGFLSSSPSVAGTINGDVSSLHNTGLSLAGKYPSGLTATSLNAKTTIGVAHSTSSVVGGSLLPMNLTNSLAGQKSSATTVNDQQPILNNYLTASALQKHIGEMLNGHHAFRGVADNGNNVTNGNQLVGVGRQGHFKDVKSIIADYRQKHPETVPRRGRRVKSASSHGNHGDITSNILGNVLKSDSKGATTDLGSLWNRMDGNSRPSSNDSSHSLTNAIASNMASGNVSFKDVLIQFAKLNEQNSNERTAASANLKSLNTAGPSSSSNTPFPEVTLHPVSTAASSLDQSGSAGSLLHGILTKLNQQNSSSTTTTTSTLVPNSTTSTATTNYNSSFSPTLARLLTAPERITSASHSLLPSYHQQASSASAGGNNNNSTTMSNHQMNIPKMVSGHNSEITITPVSVQHVPTLLQQKLEQLQHQQQPTTNQQMQSHQQQMALKRERAKLESLLNAKDDDSIDRLVIDEGGDSSIGAEDNSRIAPNAYGMEFNENEVPTCQGCMKNEAQFVCAGCADQLYCSRECQVAAWDEHSEVCTG